MKYIISILIILFFNLGDLKAQNCCIPPSLQNAYDQDVKHLALLRMEMFNAPELNFVNIDQTWQDTIWAALAAVYHSESEGRDAIFNQYCIHHDVWSTSSNYLRVSKNMYVKLDPNAPWYQNWVSGNITTNNSFIDSLLQKYGFDTVFPSLGAFEIVTTQNLNLKPLADSLEMSNSIIYAEVKSGSGGSKSIIYQKTNGQQYFDFVLGWGDCPAGCTDGYLWSFVVDNNCNASYLGSSGNPNLPPPTNCNTFANPIPVVAISETLQICRGDTATLSVSGGIGYTWATGDTTAIITVSPPSSTTYGVTVINVEGCAYEKSVTVLVLPRPIVGLSLNRDTFCITEKNIELLGGTPPGGTYNGLGISNNVFDPLNAGIGPHVVTYNYQGFNGCTNFDSQEIVVIEDCISNTKMAAIEALVKVTPNPSNGNFTIILENLIKPITVQLYDLQGRSIYLSKHESDNIKIENLFPGVYLLKISNGQFVNVSRVIVQ